MAESLAHEFWDRLAVIRSRAGDRDGAARASLIADEARRLHADFGADWVTAKVRETYDRRIRANEGKPRKARPIDRHRKLSIEAAGLA